jgi:hypothetical protein
VTPTEAGLRVLLEPGSTVELRVPIRSGRTISGYFDDVAAMAEAVARLDGRHPGIYVTANPVAPALLARAANRVADYAKLTTGDHDVARRRWLPVDLDPVRPAGIASTDAEHETALGRARQIAAFLAGQGWPAPVLADSGNGAYVLVRVDLPNDEASRELLHRCLEALAFRFDDHAVHVDLTMFNAARIIRVPGTRNCKGDSTADRPHRTARLLEVPDPPEVVTAEQLEALAATLPEPEPASRRGEPAEAFDLEAFVAEHLDVHHDGPWKQGGYRWILRACPFNADHAELTAVVLRWPDGTIGAKCQHHSCTWGWRELRERFEPGRRQDGEQQDGEQARCQGRTRAGRPCRATPAAGERFCRQHAHDDDDQDGEQERPPQASVLLQLATDAYDLGQTPTGEPFAVPKPGQGPYVARLLRGRGGSLRAELARRYAAEHDRAPNQQALADAMLVLQGRCLLEQPAELALRVARHGPGIVLDLGDATGRAVVVGPDGWEAIDRSPVLFRRTELTGVLPEPKAGGTLDPLSKLLNIDETAWPLVAAWLLAALLAPGIPHAVLLIQGEQGSAKSSAARMLARLIDPAGPQLRQPPRDLDSWTVAAAGSYVVALDNLSGVPDWLSDALCRASTGDGLVKRALYTDDGLAVVAFRRCVILNGIAFAELRGDLADRLLPVECKRLGDQQRKDDEEIAAAFEAAWPEALGGLLDLAVKVLAKLPAVQLARRPRMADFAKVIAAADAVRGTGSLDTYLELRQRAAVEALEGDPVAEAAEGFARKQRTKAWEGTASELLGAITPEPAPKGWPATPQGMGAALKRAAPALRAAGITVEQLARQGRRRPWSLTVEGEHTPSVERERNGSSPTSPTSSDEQTRRSEGMLGDDDPSDDLAAGDEGRHQHVIAAEAQTRRSEARDDDHDVSDDASRPLSAKRVSPRVRCSSCEAEAEFDPASDYGRRRLAEGHLECRAAWEPAP